MNDDELRDRLSLDIEARKERDQAETAAWFNSKMSETAADQQEVTERLGVSNSGVTRDYDQKRSDIQREYEKRKEANAAVHSQMEDDLAEGKLHHVWIDAKQERQFNDAKKVWDALVNDRLERYGKTVTEQEVFEFQEKYGSQVVSQLKQTTAREFQQRQEAERQRQAEKQERARQYQAEQQQKEAQGRVEEKEHDLRRNGMSMTFDADPTPERMKNPLDKTTAHYIRLAEESKRQKIKETEKLIDQTQQQKPVSLADQLRQKYQQNRENVQSLDEGMNM